MTGSIIYISPRIMPESHVSARGSVYRPDRREGRYGVEGRYVARGHDTKGWYKKCHVIMNLYHDWILLIWPKLFGGFHKVMIHIRAYMLCQIKFQCLFHWKMSNKRYYYTIYNETFFCILSYLFCNSYFIFILITAVMYNGVLLCKNAELSFLYISSYNGNQ